MQVTLRRKARQVGAKVAAVQQATARLEEEVLGPAAAHSSGVDRIEDDKASRLTPPHSDPTADASGTFAHD